MPIQGSFGRISDVVVPIKGPPFNLFWESNDQAPNLLIPVFTYTNTDPKTMRVSKIYVSGPVRCDVELQVDGAVVWKGGTVVTNLHPEPWDFTDAEFPVPSGKVLGVYVRHIFVGLMDFTGNVGGFFR